VASIADANRHATRPKPRALKASEQSLEQCLGARTLEIVDIAPHDP